mmetsp:Transcript_11385/g.36012  ORF Transcript_11385/g.36012 Transcript_11385/m.36012 type:complete len:295 (-) Transcript_11385:236-1120(-)
MRAASIGQTPTHASTVAHAPERMTICACTPAAAAPAAASKSLEKKLVPRVDGHAVPRVADERRLQPNEEHRPPLVRHDRARAVRKAAVPAGRCLHSRLDHVERRYGSVRRATAGGAGEGKKGVVGGRERALALHRELRARPEDREQHRAVICCVALLCVLAVLLHVVEAAHDVAAKVGVPDGDLRGRQEEARVDRQVLGQPGREGRRAEARRRERRAVARAQQAGDLLARLRSLEEGEGKGEVAAALGESAVRADERVEERAHAAGARIPPQPVLYGGGKLGKEREPRRPNELG